MLISPAVAIRRTPRTSPALCKEKLTELSEEISLYPTTYWPVLYTRDLAGQPTRSILCITFIISFLLGNSEFRIGYKHWDFYMNLFVGIFSEFVVAEEVSLERSTGT